MSRLFSKLCLTTAWFCNLLRTFTWGYCSAAIVRFRTGHRRWKLKINVSNIPEEGLNLTFSKDEDWGRQLFTDREYAGFSPGGIDGSVTVRRVRRNLYLEGTLQTEIKTDCSRCLEAARLPIDISFRYILSPVQDEPPEEQELSREDLDFVYYQDELIDLDPLLTEQILLQIPMKVLCREDCRGLCPHCGTNLNLGGCRCHEERIDSRLSILKKLKV